ncbi:DUF2889 domain-containing protein [Pseudomonas lopnurensis]|uniref:DUF2889 domain-containing protein n=1 Tax=Pseudomonas lopnurensis TaxID=1477517 RepID=UPI0028AD2079|nr:DUF2889 domain-containing protein [Pseudomonas lopnurensis]
MSSFHRRIEIVGNHAQDGGTVRAALEDDFHHFRAWVEHRDGKVSAVGGESVRYPYSACLAAPKQLEALKGMSLTGVAHSVTRQTDQAHQCTHLLDLAGLAIAMAARGTIYRRYDIEVPRRVDEQTHASLQRDDGWRLAWSIDGPVIRGGKYEGVSLRVGMARWALSELDDLEAEAALVLRRCVLISLGREYDLDRQDHAAPTGLCYSQQPERAEQALRIKGSTWDFSTRAEALCRSDQSWLKGAAE